MNIVLAVCGSISAYKSYELLRSFIKENNNVKVILTKGALNFVNLEVFKYLGAQAVYSFDDDFKAHEDAHILHIDLVKWMDKLIIAPASANTIAKMSSGVCDDLLTSTVLANTDKEIHVFPAMNTYMLHNPISQANFKKLVQRDFIIHPTDSGELACRDIGAGKLLELDAIRDLSLYSTPIKINKTITINTGATVSPLDTVRYLTNPASGKTGIEIAKVFLAKGYRVNLVCGHLMQKSVDSLKHIKHLNIVHTSTTNDMFKACEKLFKGSDVYISSAAISDISFEKSEQKLKKENFNGSLKFNTEIDILKTLASTKANQIVIGFAAESELNTEKLKDKMNSKFMDILIANKVNSGLNSALIGFGQDQNEYLIIDKSLDATKINMTKKELALMILKRVHKND